MIDRRVSVVALLLLSAPVWALKSDRNQEMTIQSDRTNVVGERAELFGDVQIDQGSLKIRAAHAVIDQKNSEIDRVVFDGTPATLQQDIENQGTLNAQANRIDYVLADDRVIFSGAVQITRPLGDTLRSERLVYHVGTGMLDAGGDQGGRVIMTIKPKPKAASN